MKSIEVIFQQFNILRPFNLRFLQWNEVNLYSPYPTSNFKSFSDTTTIQLWNIYKDKITSHGFRAMFSIITH
jgi:hypothetical protein